MNNLGFGPSRPKQVIFNRKRNQKHIISKETMELDSSRNVSNFRDYGNIVVNFLNSAISKKHGTINDGDFGILLHQFRETPFPDSGIRKWNLQNSFKQCTSSNYREYPWCPIFRMFRGLARSQNGKIFSTTYWLNSLSSNGGFPFPDFSAKFFFIIDTRKLANLGVFMNTGDNQFTPVPSRASINPPSLRCVYPYDGVTWDRDNLGCSNEFDPSVSQDFKDFFKKNSEFLSLKDDEIPRDLSMRERNNEWILTSWIFSKNNENGWNSQSIRKLSNIDEIPILAFGYFQDLEFSESVLKKFRIKENLSVDSREKNFIKKVVKQFNSLRKNKPPIPLVEMSLAKNKVNRFKLA